ncbi:Uncharacterised protein [Mycobacteroides abscessus subsp. abscessus]|nr:Uncharacterised protein [Mycobacteroides abscessus subsp. abscessus]
MLRAAVLETLTVGIEAGRTDVVDGPVFGHDLTQLGLADGVRSVDIGREGRLIEDGIEWNSVESMIVPKRPSYPVKFEMSATSKVTFVRPRSAA